MARIGHHTDDDPFGWTASAVFEDNLIKGLRAQHRSLRAVEDLEVAVSGESTHVAAIGRRSVELIVVAYRSRAQVEQMLAGLPPDLPLVVVDNSDGADGLREVIEARRHGRYLPGGGVGFGRAANHGARTSSAEYLVFVNPDTRPRLEDIATLVEDVATDPTCAASAGTLVEQDGRPQIGVAGWEPSLLRSFVHASGLHKLLPSHGLFMRPTEGESADIDWVSGGCMAVRRDTFLELGAFDEDFFVYNEDMALGRASRDRGLRQRLRTDVLIHGESGRSGAPPLEMMRLRGASMSRYLRRRHPPLVWLSMMASLVAGYAIRAAMRLVVGDLARAKEHWAWVSGGVTGTATVGGRVVTQR